MGLISREAAIEEFEDMVTSVSVYGESAEARYATNARLRFIEKLNSIPTVDAAPVVHGQWIHCEGKSSIWYCSVCGDKIIYNPTRKTYKPDKKPVWEINKYCRNCGALMDAGGEDEST